MSPATPAQKRFGGLPYGKPKRKLTEAEILTGETSEKLRERQMELKAAAMRRFLGEKAA